MYLAFQNGQVKEMLQLGVSKMMKTPPALMHNPGQGMVMWWITHMLLLQP
jgi:hypothetical protein